MSERKRLPDLGDLTGILDEHGRPVYKWEISDAPNPDEVQADLDNLRRYIDSLPAGSLSGGRIFEPENWNEEYDGPYERPGLTDEEKQVIWNAHAPQIENMSGPQREQMKRIRSQVAEVADRLNEEFAERYPEYGDASHAEIAEAAQRVVADLRENGQHPGRAIADDHEGFLDGVAFEIDMARGGHRSGSNATRTRGLSHSGGGFRDDNRSREDEKPDDMIDDIRAWQKKTGYF